jgi:hypothetical protein
MNLYIAAVLMAVIGCVCALLCAAWSIPSWRRRLRGPALTDRVLGDPAAKGLSGWQGRIFSAVISIGIAICAMVSWYGCYCVLAALGHGPG